MIPVSYNISTDEVWHYDIFTIIIPFLAAYAISLQNFSSVYILPAPYVSITTPFNFSFLNISFNV